MAKDMGVTAAAQILLSDAAGGLEQNGTCRVIDVAIHLGTLTLEDRATGNTYRLTAVQLTGPDQ